MTSTFRYSSTEKRLSSLKSRDSAECFIDDVGRSCRADRDIAIVVHRCASRPTQWRQISAVDNCARLRIEHEDLLFAVGHVLADDVTRSKQRQMSDTSFRPDRSEPKRARNRSWNRPRPDPRRYWAVSTTNAIPVEPRAQAGRSD